MITGHEANIVACMEPVPASKTQLAKARRATSRYELEQQKLFGAFLRKLKKAGQLNYLWPRTDKATTIQVGHWDFTVWLPCGKELRFEFKAPGAKCSAPQQETIALMERLGHPVLIVTEAAEAERQVRFFMHQTLL